MIIREFSVFLGTACRRIPIKKLKRRIFNEMNEHMEDMLDEYLKAGEEREAAIEKVVEDMGDPVKTNKELRRTHCSEIFLPAPQGHLSLFLLLYCFFISLILMQAYPNILQALQKKK